MGNIANCCLYSVTVSFDKVYSFAIWGYLIFVMICYEFLFIYCSFTSFRFPIGILVYRGFYVFHGEYRLCCASMYFLFILALSCFLWCFIRLSSWSCIYCFDAGGGEFPEMCGWLLKTMQMTCAKARFLEEASVSLPSDPNVEVYQFLHRIYPFFILWSIFIPLFAFLVFSSARRGGRRGWINHAKDMQMVWVWRERVSKGLKELFSIQVHAAVPSLPSCPEDSFC
jgi:hypothetical protein